MSIVQYETVQDAFDTRLGTVSGIPATRYNGDAPIAPAPSVPYTEADFVPATTTTITVGQNSEVERTGLYVVRLYSATGDGDSLPALADDVLAQFKRGDTFATSDSVIVRITGNPGPSRGAVVATRAGRSAVPITIPWLTRSVD